LEIQEADRLVLLLKQDLPSNVFVLRNTKERGFVESGIIKIYRNNRLSINREDCVEIMVTIQTELIQQSHGCQYQRGVKLGYTFDFGKDVYDSVEEMIEKSRFLEAIITKVL
jgi:hypothetical protein